jgi:trehalose/maltose hydrolase-like predicted phosphorylase
VARRRSLRLIPWLALPGLLPGCTPPAPAPGPAAAPPRGPAPIRVSSDPWVISTDAWGGPEYRGVYLGNGFLGQRFMQTGGLYAGAAEPAFMAGYYIREGLAPILPLTPLQVTSNGHVFGAEPTRIRKYHQELRLKDGLLVTQATWDDGAGSVDLEATAAVLRQRPDTALLTLSVQNHGTAPVTVGVPEGVAPDAPSAGESVPGTVRYASGSVTCRAVLAAGPNGPAPAAGDGMKTRCVVPAQGTAQLSLTTQFSRPGPAAPPVRQPDPAKSLDAHRAAWNRLWASDIEIDGDPEAQEVARACRFYLLSSIRPESAAGVPPMGLSSGAFNGHVFWDMDSWMLPALLPQHPDLARAMLEYRYRTLPGARANAQSERLPGASYAWESAATGRETQLREVFRHGRHVTGDVALALKQYYLATGDNAWLRSRAWPILKETADNWAARAQPGPGGTYVIKQVTTPDELAGQVDHSAWTQHVARVNLEFASVAAKQLGLPRNPKWATVANGLTFLRDPESHLILPYAGFGKTTQAKQADALLLIHPGMADLPPAEVGRMYDFYAPRVIKNGPAMTDAIHAIVAARLGRGDEALARFRQSYQPFVRPPYHLFSEKRTRDNLCFLTGAAGVLEAVLYGFAGLHPEGAPPGTTELAGHASAQPRLDPHLPPGWKALRLRNLQWRGFAWDVEIKAGAPPVWTRRKKYMSEDSQ